MQKELCEKLREAGAALGRGEVDDVRLPYGYILQHFDSDFEKANKITAGYIRTIINRVPEIKAEGRVSVKREQNEDGVVFVITVNRDPKRKVITSQDMPAIEAKIRNKFLKRLLNFIPNITDLQGDALQGAAIGVQRYQEMIKEMMNEDSAS